MHLGSTCRGCLSCCVQGKLLIDTVVSMLCNLLSILLVISGKIYPFLHLVQLHTSNRTASKPSNSSWALLAKIFLDGTHFCYILVQLALLLTTMVNKSEVGKCWGISSSSSVRNECVLQNWNYSIDALLLLMFVLSYRQKCC